MALVMEQDSIILHDRNNMLQVIGKIPIPGVKLEDSFACVHKSTILMTSKYKFLVVDLEELRIIHQGLSPRFEVYDNCWCYGAYDLKLLLLADDVAVLTTSSFVQLVYLGDGSRPWVGRLGKAEANKLLAQQIKASSSEGELSRLTDSLESEDATDINERFSRFLWKVNPGLLL
jgi:hypothetical protein